ncbi:MAG: hypothetical protein HYZ28_19065 [Myxococcales bacterium]|nr:hypothetical protein [Myxococcales bacterium]
MSHSRLFIALVLTSTAGCRCGPGGSGGLLPDFDPTPKALSFEACPTKDENGKPVKDVFPDRKKVSLRNLGKAPGNVVISFTGPGKDVFSVIPEETPTTLDALLEREFPVLFTPVARGDTTAEMVIDDGQEATSPVVVSLVGSGRNLPSQATLEVAAQNKDITTQFDPCYSGLICQLLYPDTFYKESSVLKLKIKNTGCPALKITGLEVAPLGAGGGNLAYTLDEPALPPTDAAPLVLTTADGNAESTVTIRFAPEDDGSGITQRYAILKIKTNDPNLNTGDGDPTNDGVYDVQFAGNASQPAVYATPTFCDFSQPADTCGFATRQLDQARFEVKNGGNVDIAIDSVKLSNGGTGGRFTITQNVQGQIIAPGSSKNLEVSHTDAPLYVSELLTVTAKAGGASAGSAIITLAGGVKPCLTTDPLDQLDFQNPSADVSSKQVSIKNGAGCGDLVVNRVYVDTQPFFSVVDPLVPAGTTVKGGTAVLATVQYKKPVSGGIQTGVLRADSNDPDFGPPPYKVVRLYSESPLDQLPVAVLKGCLPTETDCSKNGSLGSMTVRLSNLTPKELTMFGKDSYDPGNTSATPISYYLFRLVTKPTNASNAKLASDGVKTTNSSVKLTLDPLATGLYRVTLTVYDDKGQPSAIAAELKITVNQ